MDLKIQFMINDLNFILSHYFNFVDTKLQNKAIKKLYLHHIFDKNFFCAYEKAISEFYLGIGFIVVGLQQHKICPRWGLFAK